MTFRGSRGLQPWLSAFVAAGALLSATSAFAQAPAEVAAAEVTTTGGIAAIIAQHAAQPDNICKNISPLISANPETAAEVVTAASADPTLAEPLAQCLAEIQQALKDVDPEAAKQIADIVAAAGPAFQAAYAVALSPGDDGGGADGGTQVATTAGGGSATGGGGAPYSPGGGGGTGGFGGGPVSPN